MSGAFALAIPVSFSEEVWIIRITVKGYNSFLGVFACQNVFQGKFYIKFPFFSVASLVLKRLVTVTMPASMDTIVVDSFDKE